jgi:hypothetical protein
MTVGSETEHPPGHATFCSEGEKTPRHTKFEPERENSMDCTTFGSKQAIRNNLSQNQKENHAEDARQQT